MAASIIQERNSETTTTGLTFTLAFSTNTTAGNAIHAIVDYGEVTIGTKITVTFSDTSNTYGAQLDNLDDGSGNAMAHGAAVNIAGGADTVKATWASAPNTFQGIWIREIGGTSTTGPDNHAATAFAAGTTNPSVNLTLNASSGLISAACAGFNVGNLPSAGTGWTLGLNSGWKDNNAVACATSESEHFTSSGVKSVAFIQATTDNYMIMAASFADASGAAPVKHFLACLGAGA